MAYKPTKNTPVHPITTQENARKWLSVIRFGESASIVQPQDDCEYRVSEVINNVTFLKKYLGPYYRKYLLAYVPLGSEDLEQTIQKALLGLCAKRNILSPKLIKSDSGKILNYILKKGYDVGLFISHLSLYLNTNGLSTLLHLEKILEESHNVSLVMFFEQDITNPTYRHLVDKCSLFFDNVMFYPLYDDQDSRQFIRYQCELWDMKVSAQMEKRLFIFPEDIFG